MAVESVTGTTTAPATAAATSGGSAQPDFGRIHDALLGSWKDIRLAARARTLDPALHRRDDTLVAEHRARVTAQLQVLLDSGAVRLPFPEQFGGSGDAGGNLVAFEELVTADPSLQTLPVLQQIFQTQFSNDYNVAFASYLMAMAPAILVYLFTQRWVMAGVTQGAIK